MKNLNKIVDKIEKNIYHASIREATEKELQIVVDIYNKSWLTSNTPFRPMEKESWKNLYSFDKIHIFFDMNLIYF